MILGRCEAKSRVCWHSRNQSAKRLRVQFVHGVLQFPHVRADTRATMRTLGFRTHALLTLAAAVGMIAALAEPRYGLARNPPGADNATGRIHGPGDGRAAGMQRWVTGGAGTSGWDGLGMWGSVLAGLAA